MTLLLLVAAICHADAEDISPGANEPGSDVPGQGKDYSPYPQPDSGYVTDIAGVLSYEEEERIEQWLFQVEKKTNVEIIVVVLDSIRDYRSTANQSIESFATGLFNKYGIGNMPKNDGVLLLVAVKDRKARIELGAAYGHERDSDSARIMDRTIIPRFKKGDYAGGTTRGVKALCREFAGARIGVPVSLIVIPVAIVLLSLVAVSLFRNGKRGWGWVCVGLIIILLLLAIAIIVTLLRALPRSASSSWGAGGLGGFGGGFSGGGGATGSW